MKNEKEQNEVRWGNIFDYLTWRGDLSFTQSPFNIIDGLIFSTLAYLRFETEGDAPLRFADAVGRLMQKPYEERYNGIFIIRDQCIRLAGEAAECRRFRETSIMEAVEKCSEEKEEEFAGMTFLLPDGSAFIAYRGTGDSLVGWKEDFNMAFISGTPSQVEAAAYAQRIAARHEGTLHIGGHSKGGNLAVWAAAYLPAGPSERLERVYNYDGPGFLDEFLQSSQYLGVKDKIISVVPESSIVGVLMGSSEYLTIKSSSYAVLQHDMFSWRVAGKRFDYDLERSRSGRTMERTLNGLLNEMSREEREAYVDEIYAEMKSLDLKNLSDIEKNKVHHLFVTLPKLIRKGYSVRTSLKK